MTGFQHRNAVKFGSFITFDCCHRENNVVNWLYIAVVSKNEFGSPCVLVEGILTEEQETSYQWITQCLFCMCRERSPNQYLCVATDAFCNIKMIRRLGYTNAMTRRLGYTNAHFIIDSWHMYQALINKFSCYYASVSNCLFYLLLWSMHSHISHGFTCCVLKLKTYLNGMINARNEAMFNNHCNKARQSIKGRNITLL